MISLAKILESEISKIKDKISELNNDLEVIYENALRDQLMEEIFPEPDTEAFRCYKGLHPDPHGETLKRILLIKNKIENQTNNLNELLKYQEKHSNDIKKLEKIWLEKINNPDTVEKEPNNWYIVP